MAPDTKSEIHKWNLGPSNPFLYEVQLTHGVPSHSFYAERVPSDKIGDTDNYVLMNYPAGEKAKPYRVIRLKEGDQEAIDSANRILMTSAIEARKSLADLAGVVVDPEIIEQTPGTRE